RRKRWSAARESVGPDHEIIFLIWRDHRGRGWSLLISQTGMFRRPRLRASAIVPCAPPSMTTPPGSAASTFAILRPRASLRHLGPPTWNKPERFYRIAMRKSRTSSDLATLPRQETTDREFSYKRVNVWLIPLPI